MAQAPRKWKSDKRAAQRLSIVSAATRCVCRSGFDAASIQMIADEVGMPSSLLYRYFRDKKAILSAVADTFLKTMVKDMAAMDELDILPLTSFQRIVSSHGGLYFEIRSAAERYDEVANVFSAYLLARRSVLEAQVVQSTVMLTPAEVTKLVDMHECLFDGFVFNAFSAQGALSEPSDRPCV